jgi:hypothetical protein
MGRQIAVMGSRHAVMGSTVCCCNVDCIVLGSIVLGSTVCCNAAVWTVLSSAVWEEWEALLSWGSIVAVGEVLFAVFGKQCLLQLGQYYLLQFGAVRAVQFG